MKTYAKYLASLLVMGLVLSGCSDTGAVSGTSADNSAAAVSSVGEDTDNSGESTEGTTLTAETGADGNAEYADIFEKDRVIDIDIDVSEDDWATILYDPMAEEYVSADVTVDGTKVSDVGIRAKGNSSLMSVANSDSDRFSLRVKFDEYVDDQNLLGLDELVLNNCFNDPSYMREYLTYEAFRELGSDTPLTVYANIYINGELFGFYLCVEDVGESFLEREFESDNGNLYKAGQGSSLSSDSAIDSFSLKTGDDETLSGIQKVIDTLSEMPDGEKGDIETVLDVDSVLMYMAANTVLGSYDSYLGEFSQNYYLYESEGIFTMIPWDYNMSFGGFSNDNGDSTTIPIDEPVMGVTMESRPLAAKLLSVDEYLQKYHGYIETLSTYLSNIESRTDALAEIIRPYIAADSNAFYTIEEFEAAITLSDSRDKETADSSTPSAASDAAAADTDASDEASSGTIPTGTIPTGTRPTGEMPSGTIPTGEMPSGAIPPGDFAGDGYGFTPDDFAGEFPAGGNPGGGAGNTGGPGGMAGGGMPGGSINAVPVSILDYAADRLLNITQQLAGTLPTTGNTTAVNSNTKPDGNTTASNDKNPTDTEAS